MTVHVLVVEDEPVAARAHRTFVERMAGFEVVDVAGTFADAVRALGAHQVDLVLLDMQLPDGHGLDLLRQLRATAHPSHVIAVTSARDADVVRQAASQGVVGYLLKPFTAAMLEAKLRQYADFRSALETTASVDQTAVDAVFDAMRPRREVALPKGLSAETLVKVRQLLGGSDQARTASEVADRIGTSRVTARRYLEYLADAGQVDRSTRHGGSGRPHVEYRSS
ncbi:response regulator [Luteipulveratus mongoliensis]|uniref:Transcriptional regulatory protein n=1 Tax=Luteipulveratus mongoliensis TaxID=571913 RepID=A0A0K1JJM9_9MICO|nr:response regulator [Luteipulveratus mongoliensis]AKU16934.1 hypothetical protein VV02_15510 [Luteipulveratus mongoliensis]